MIEPQQTEGELVENPYPDAHYPGCQNEVFAHGSEAQRAHMIQQGWVKLPSEDEVADRLRTSFEENGYRNYRETAQELLRLLKEGK
jgi:hypothetical protein